jgi:hypothetical protein
MSALFSPKGILVGLVGMLLLLGGCGEREPAVIKPPQDAAKVIEPFLRELAAGQKNKAAAFVSSGAIDELDTQFAADHKKLAAAAKLTPRFVTRSGDTPVLSDRVLDSEGNKATLVYAAKSKGKWTTVTVRVAREPEDAFKVEYWRVSNDAPTGPLPPGMDTPEAKQAHTMMAWVMGALALLGLFGIIALLWIIRRKPHLVVPEETLERRQSATTLREE